MNSYDLSRAWFDFCFKNPEKVNPNHSAIFFFAIEHCNRLGWKEKFGFPTQMTMDAIGIKKHQTYIKYFNELCEWGFFIMVQKSVNQYSANIIKLSTGYTKNGKALDKAFITHAAKQTEKQSASIGQSTGQSNSSIDKQYNNEQLTRNQLEEEEEEKPKSNFLIVVQLKPVTDLKKFIKENFSRTHEELQMKVPQYAERQEAFMLRNNERSYTSDNDFLNHYRNFILKPPPIEKEKSSGQKEKPSRIEQILSTHEQYLNSLSAG